MVRRDLLKKMLKEMKTRTHLGLEIPCTTLFTLSFKGHCECWLVLDNSCSLNE